MSTIAAEIFEIQRVLDEVFDWVQKNKMGLSREDAKRIFHRYRSDKGKPEEPTPPSSPPESPSGDLDRQSKQITQILGYMEDTNQRLDQIENDIGYIKDRVDAILKKLCISSNPLIAFSGFQ